MLGCPECGLRLVSRLAALVPCGHVCHASCAEFICTDVGDDSDRTRCPHCGDVTVAFRVLQATDDSTETTTQERENVNEALAKIRTLQSEVTSVRRQVSARAADERNLQRKCASLHASVQFLKRSIDESFPAAGAEPSSASTRDAAKMQYFGSSSSSNATVSSLVDPQFTSIRQLQEYVAAAEAMERDVRERTTHVEETIRQDNGVLRGLRAMRKTLRAEERSEPVPRRRTRQREEPTLPTLRPIQHDCIVVCTEDECDGSSSHRSSRGDDVVIVDGPSSRTLPPHGAQRQPLAVKRVAAAFVHPSVRFGELPGAIRVQRSLVDLTHQ